MMHGTPNFHYNGPGEFSEHFFYAGTIGMLAALFGVAVLLRRRDNRPVAAIAVTGVICLLFSLGSNNPFMDLYRWLIQVPGFNLFRCPARWSLVPTLTIAILSGYGLQALIGYMQAGKLTAPIVTLAVCAFAAPLIVYAFALNEEGVRGWMLLEKVLQLHEAELHVDGIDRMFYAVFRYLSPAAYFLLFLLALLLALLAAYRLPTRYCAAAIVVLGLLDMLCVVKPANHKAGPDFFPANPQHIAYLQRNAGEYRALSPDDMRNAVSLNNSMGAYYGVQSIRGYAALHLSSYLMLSEHFSNPEILDYAGVKYEIQRANDETAR
jgi:hypothetical protein